MIEEGVITGIDARPGTAGRGGQAGLARGLRRPQPQTCRGPRIGHQVAAGPCGWPSGDPPCRHGDGLRFAASSPAPGTRQVRRRAQIPFTRARARTLRLPAAARPATRIGPLPAAAPVTAGLTPGGPRADAEEPAHQRHGGIPHGRPGRVPDLRTPGRPRPPCAPGHRTARVTTAISAPACPGAGQDARPAQRRPSSHGTAAARPVRGRPWKADGAHRPSWRPGPRPLCVRGHRNTTAYSATR